MDVGLLDQNPGMFFVSLIVSLAITLAAYSAFPLIYAGNRTDDIEKRKYVSKCYLVNFCVMILFTVLNGGTPSVAPYILWTSVFSKSGVKKLEARNLLADSKVGEASAAKYDQPVSSAAQPVPVREPMPVTQPMSSQPRYCRYCGNKLAENSRFCSTCGAAIAETERKS